MNGAVFAIGKAVRHGARAEGPRAVGWARSSGPIWLDPMKTVAEFQSDGQGDPSLWIVAIATDRSREGFALLFSRFAPRVKSYLLKLGCKPDLAEDLAQETLLTVWRKASYFDPSRASASTWVFTIARNLRNRRPAPRAASGRSDRRARSDPRSRGAPGRGAIGS